MRVMLVSDVTAPGGVDAHMASLAKWAQPLGIEVELLVDGASLTPVRETRLMSSGAVLHRANIYHRRYSAAEQRANVAELLEKRRPDVVHVMCGIPWSCLDVREAVIELGVPLVFTESYVPRGLQIEKRVTERISRLYARVPAVIFLCGENRLVLQDEHDISSDAAVIIPSAVEVRPLRRARSGCAGAAEPFRLVVTARLAHQKGIDTLIEAAQILRESVDWAFTVDLFGDGPMRSELERQTCLAGLVDHVRFRGWRLDAADYLAEFDCYVLPSRSEGQPFAMLEAMVVGLPVVASAVSGIPEALEGGKGGILVPAEDPQALADAITMVRTNPAGARERARDAHLRVSNCHNIERAVIEHLKVWRHATAHG